MRETAADVAELQRRLDDSIGAAGEHLRRIFDDAHRPSAQDICTTLDGIVEVDLACVTGDGTPIVAPIDAIVFRGRLWVGIPSPAVRARLVRRDPRVSAAYNHGGFALVVHGTLRDAGDLGPPYRELMRELYVAAYGPGWLDWYDGLDHSDDVVGWIEPRRIFARRA